VKWRGQNGHSIDFVASQYHIANMPSEIRLVEAVQKELKREVSKADATRLVTAVINAIKIGSRKDSVVRVRGFGTFRLVTVEAQKRKTIRVPPRKDSRPSSSRLPEPTVEMLTPNEERLAVALQAVISATGADGGEALRVMRTIGEGIELPTDAADEAFERVRLRSLGADVELWNAEGGGLSDIEFATRLGLGSRETVRQYREKGRIFAWRKDMRSYRYPAWQIHGKQLLRGLSEVLGVLKEKQLEPPSIISYFLTPSDDLDNARPLDLLRDGKVVEVVADAKRYGDIGS
jgi:nucleoid DNA-binding protein